MGKAFPSRDGFHYRHPYFQLLHDSPAVQQFIYQESIMGDTLKYPNDRYSLPVFRINGLL